MASAQLGLNRVEADIDPRNAASAKPLLRLGFRHEGLLRERWIVNGEICDTAFYGLLKSDWEARRLPLIAPIDRLSHGLGGSSDANGIGRRRAC